MISFVDFCGSLGVVLTQGQRVLVSVAFDRVEPRDLHPSDRETARLIFGPIEVVPEVARAVLVAVCGARGGKSYVLGALYSLYRALTGDLSKLAAGEVAVAVIVAPDLRLARQAMRYALGAAKAVPSLARLIVSETSDAFTLQRPDGGLVAIECLPATRGGSALRGRTLVSAVLDESAFFRDSDSVINDEELFRAVAPRVLPGGMVVIASTPWAEAGLLHSEFAKNHGHPKTAVGAWAPTLLLRGHDPSVQAVVAREEARDPENARREYGAEFAQASEALFSSEDIAAACEPRGDLDRVKGVTYACSIDLAMRSDFSVALVGHRELRSVEGQPPRDMLVVDVARAWKPERNKRLDVEVLEFEIAGLANYYRAPKILADGWGADFFGARLRTRGILLDEQSMAPTAQAHRAGLLAAMFRQKRIGLPDDPELRKQLGQIRVTRSAGGHMRFASPDRKGSHDDYPKALMLLAEVAASLPAGGGDIRRRWNGSENVWSHVSETGAVTPCLPPQGSRDWLRLCARCQREGLHIEAVDAWLLEPANREAVDRYLERANKSFSLSR